MSDVHRGVQAILQGQQDRDGRITLLHKTIKLQPTDTYLDIFVCEDYKVANSYIKKFYRKIDPDINISDIDPHSRSSFGRWFPMDSIRLSIWIPSIEPTPDSINNVVHETRHLMQRWCDHFELEHGANNAREWQAYFHAWIAEKIFIRDGYAEIECEENES